MCAEKITGTTTKESDMRNSGYLVEHKDGRKGRTFHKKGTINGKIPVYFATKHGALEDDLANVPLEFSDKALLCSPDNLKRIGFID